MQTLVKISEKELETMEFPFDSISWDWDGDLAYYFNEQHTIDTEDFMLVFHLRVSGREGDERNNAWVGEISEVWVGEELVELSQQEEDVLRSRLEKHYSDPNNAN